MRYGTGFQPLVLCGNVPGALPQAGIERPSGVKHLFIDGLYLRWLLFVAVDSYYSSLLIASFVIDKLIPPSVSEIDRCWLKLVPIVHFEHLWEPEYLTTKQRWYPQRINVNQIYATANT